MKDHYELLAEAILEIDDEPAPSTNEPDPFAEIIAELEGEHPARQQCCGA